MNEYLLRWSRGEAEEPADEDGARWMVGAADESGQAVARFDALIGAGRYWLDAYKVAMFDAMVRQAPTRRLAIRLP